MECFQELSQFSVDITPEINNEAERPIDGDCQPKLEGLTLESVDNLDSERPNDDGPKLNIEQAQTHIENTEKNGLTDEEKVQLKEETGWSDEIIDNISSMEEAEIYKNAGLKEVEINGKPVLIKDDIDLDQIDEDGISNRERMERGRPPITKDGETIELHHIGQKADSPLAELTTEQHRGTGNDTILHDKTKESEIDRQEFAKERQEHWKNRV